MHKQCFKIFMVIEQYASQNVLEYINDSEPMNLLILYIYYFIYVYMNIYDTNGKLFTNTIRSPSLDNIGNI